MIDALYSNNAVFHRLNEESENYDKVFFIAKYDSFSLIFHFEF